MKLILSAILMTAAFAMSACSEGAKVGQTSMTPSDAIVGGREVSPEEPLSKRVVLLYDTTGGICTASLISSDLLLTAAHCVESGASKLVALFGHSIEEASYISDKIKVAKVVTYPAYHNPMATIRGDVAVVKLVRPAPSEYEIALLPPLTLRIPSGTELISIGYGRTEGTQSEDGDNQGSGILRTVGTLVADIVLNREGIGIDQSNGQGVCNGDSGGPAYYQVGDKFYVVGIAHAVYYDVPDEIADDQEKVDEYLKNLDICKQYGVYMSVGFYKNWILDQMALLNPSPKK